MGLNWAESGRRPSLVGVQRRRIGWLVLGLASGWIVPDSDGHSGSRTRMVTLPLTTLAALPSLPPPCSSCSLLFLPVRAEAMRTKIWGPWNFFFFLLSVWGKGEYLKHGAWALCEGFYVNVLQSWKAGQWYGEQVVTLCCVRAVETSPCTGTLGPEAI